MSANLYTQLQHAKTEEDVKDAYIKALGLKKYSKGLIDIQTEEIWFEAKDKSGVSNYAMFTQLLFYVQDAVKKGEHVPPFLAVIDTEKAAIMKTADVLPLLKDKKIKWGQSASKYNKEALDAVSAYIGTRFVSFKIATHEEEFISTVKAAIKGGDIIRTQITPDNLKQVFDKWVEMIGREIGGVPEDKYNLLFFADIMTDGKISTHANLPAELLWRNDEPVFSLEGKIYELGSREGYRQFWAIYHRPPQAEYRNYLLERRDSLIPIDERSFKGAYYTPLHVVDKAYDKLAETLGKNWQRDFVVWDMCCGVGNLEVKHSNPRNIFMSTLDQADVDVMKATKTCVAATRFQYDYLNDDITDDGRVDYSLTNKVPAELRKAIAEGKKILVLINPPYAEATNSDNINSGGKTESKTGVAATKIGALMKSQDYGYAARELFVQFLARIAKEIPTATIAMFSTLKYVNAPNFEKFRQSWNAKFEDGFIVHSKAFDGLKGNFPIGFLIWKTNQQGKKTPITQFEVDVLDKDSNPIGAKNFYNLPAAHSLNLSMPRLKTNSINIPLKNAIQPQTGKAKVSSWVDVAIGYLWCNGSDMQQASQTAILSSVFSAGNGFYITPQNLWQAAVVFAVRQLIKHTWINHNDQFLQPTAPLTDEFKTDCLIWMLFHGKNLTASANDLEWNGKKWSIVNHFIPFTEAEVNAPDRFESDFMVKYLAGNLPLPLRERAGVRGKKPSHREYAPYIKEFARALRKNQTEAESKFWQLLRNNNTGYKFRRQFAIDSKYIADFISLEKRLIIEIDGGQHNENIKDMERTLYLAEQDFRVIRFWNNEVLQNLEGCYEILLKELNTPHPNPLPQGERELSGTTQGEYISSPKKLSPEAKAVMDDGRELWKTYFAVASPYIVREEYKLNRTDVGWYQIRKALEKRDGIPVDFKPFKAAYELLTEKLAPQVFELGFLKA